MMYTQFCVELLIGKITVDAYVWSMLHVCFHLVILAFLVSDWFKKKPFDIHALTLQPPELLNDSHCTDRMEVIQFWGLKVKPFVHATPDTVDDAGGRKHKGVKPLGVAGSFLWR